MSLPTGRVLHDRYRIIRLLGQGGYGAVYQVWDSHLERDAALKENLNVSPDTQRQFKREAILLSRLAHPNLPRVIDHFVLPDYGQYLVMDYIDGQDLLDRVVERGPLAEDQARVWIGQVCAALEYLHTQTPPVIHRDVKPANIRVNSQGQAVLVDFGIAKVFEPGLATTVGAQAVSHGFSPLEQYGRGGRTDARTDVYALGATLYFLLTGQVPTDALDRNLGEPLPDIRALNPSVSVQTASAVNAAMAVHPSDRLPSIAAFRELLEGKPGALPVQPVPVHAAAAARTEKVALSARSSPEAYFPATVRSTSEPDDLPVSRRFPWRAVILAFMLIGLCAISGLAGAGALRSLLNPDGSNANLPVLESPTLTTALPSVDVETDTPTPVATDTPRPPPSITPVPTLPPGRITQVTFCNRPCDDPDAVQSVTYPEGSTRIYFAFQYENMRPDQPYSRYWVHRERGQEWVRYNCRWGGPPDGVFYGRLWDARGLHSGTWILTIEVEGQPPVVGTVFVEGSETYWDSPGTPPCVDWTN